MRNLHRHLEQRLAWYRRWHSDPTAEVVHLSLLFLFMVLIVGTIASFGHSKAASGTTYYVAANGSDANAGTSQSAPWQTLAKVNSTVLAPGDSVLFRKGDTFYGGLVATSSGTSSAPITYGAYGSGAKPVITGLKTITGWTSLGNGIYEAGDPSFTSSMLNMVTLNGALQPIGRWPKVTASNGGYLTASGVTSNSITSSSLSSAASFVGAEVVYRPVHWILNRRIVTAQTSSTVTFNQTNATYPPASGFGFFFQNSPAALTALGDWAYNTSTKKLDMYFGSASPSSYVVQASAVDTIVPLSSRSYLNFDGIAFSGGNSKIFSLANATHIAISNADIAFAGVDGIDVSNELSNNISVTNSTISNINNNGIDFQEASYLTIRGNTFSSIGMIAGMGQSEDQQYFGAEYIGDNSVVDHNQMSNIGYIPLMFSGTNLTVKNNYVHDYCAVKNDCGGIYMYGSNLNGSIVSNNIVANGIGNSFGESGAGAYAEGIYTDDGTSNVSFVGNTVTNVANAGFYIHNSHEVQLENNVSFANGIQLEVEHDDISPQNPIRNLSMTGNSFVSKSSSQPTFKFSTISNDVLSFGTADNNYYARPASEPTTLSVPGTSNTLASWQSYSGQDAHSKKSPVSIANASQIFFDYNPSDSPKTDSLSGTYVDMSGATNATCSVTIPAWGSVVLLQTSTTCTGAAAPAADTTAPTVSLTAPSNNATVSGTITVSAAASDDTGVDHVDFYRGSTLISGDSSSPYSATLDTTLLSNGTYTLTARAYDAAGNSAASGSVSITVSNTVAPAKDTTPPAVSITAPSAGSSLSGIVTLSAAASDDTGVSQVAFYQGSTLLDSDTTGSPYSISWDTSAVANGTYTLTARASDAAGNTATSGAVSVTVNNAAVQPPAATSTAAWTYCAAENGTCSFSGTQQVRYGANDTYAYKTATGSIACNNTTFGDPLVGTVKHCDYAATTSTTTTTTPTPAPTATLAVGAKVATTSSVTVRSTATVFARSTGSQKKGATGTITAGPTTSSGYTWWKVDFSSGADGWVPSKYLKVQ